MLSLRPIWAYGIHVWGCAKPSQTKTIQAFQSITLRLLTSAPWYISNNSLHNDLKIETFTTVASKHYKKFHSKLATHNNPLKANQGGANLYNNPTRRLKRRWCKDLLNSWLQRRMRVLSLDSLRSHTISSCKYCVNKINPICLLFLCYRL